MRCPVGMLFTEVLSTGVVPKRKCAVEVWEVKIVLASVGT